MTVPLFDEDVAAAAVVASGVRAAGRPDPAVSDAALVGDGFGWLAGWLPAPCPPGCERCGALMVLPPAVPELWVCPACHPGEVGSRG